VNLFQTLFTAWRDLTLHKFRTVLATLGVIFGVSSVVAMLSISEGARRQSHDNIAALGVDNITVVSVKPTRLSENQSGNRGGLFHYGLTRRDLDHIRETFNGVQEAVGMRDMRSPLFSTSGRELDVRVIATEPEFLHVTRSHMKRGRFLHWLDAEDRKTVCVLGRDAARQLFRYEDPIGRSVQIASQWYRVVGILENPASLRVAGGQDVNSYVFLPLRTAQALGGDVSFTRKPGGWEAVRVELDGITVQVDSVASVEVLSRRMRNFLTRTHKDPDYEMMVPLELIRSAEKSQRIFSIVMASIAAISLLVGGIGIMNIMLANVTERRKEIGTRRALGARRIDIIGQFLVESATLTGLGGLAGVAVGYGLSEAVGRYAGWPVFVTPLSVMLGLVVSCGVGVVFGLWPAYQAARVRPIEALRSE